jgi:two-component system, chemotaxis family, response regulator Rcp1
MKAVEILLVEDDPGDVRLTAEALKESGFPFHLTVAKDGDEALNCLYKVGKYVNNPTPELVLLDLNLPTMSGKDVLKIIKHDNVLSQIPIVVLTTSKDEEDINASYNLHANSFITKPTDLERFIEIIKITENYWVNIARLPSQAGEENPAEKHEDMPEEKPKEPEKVTTGPNRGK